MPNLLTRKDNITDIMEDLIRKRMNVADANGWYLAEAAYRKWNEDFIDEDAGEVVTVERNEIVAPVGEQLTPITVSLLQVNGITEILVSDKKITGAQQKHLSLWQLECVTVDFKGKERSSYFIIPKGSPLECELFFKAWAEQNIKGQFTIKKVVPLDYLAVLSPYDDEIEEAVHERNVPVYFFKAVIKGDDYSKKVMVLADSLHTAESAISAEYHIKPYHYGDDRISELKEINVSKIFDEGIRVARYSLAMYNPLVTGHLAKAFDKIIADISVANEQND